MTLRASDGEHSDTLAVTVTVTNVEETGALALSSEQPQVGALLTADLTDPDGSITSESWTWQRSTNRSSWSEISGATSNSYTPVTADVGYYLRATVEYTDGHGSGKRLRETSDQRTQPPPPVNHPPEFSEHERRALRRRGRARGDGRGRRGSRPATRTTTGWPTR